VADLAEGRKEITPLRVLFINDYREGGGAEVVLSQLMRGLKERQIDTEFFYGAEGNKVRASNPFSYIYSYRSRSKLAEKLRAFCPNIVHVLNYYHLLSPSILDALVEYKKKHPRVRVVYSAHDFHLVCPSSGLTSFAGREGVLTREPPRRNVPGFFGLGLLLKKWDHRGWLYSQLKVFQWLNGYVWHAKHSVFDKMIAPGEFMDQILSASFPSHNVELIRNPYQPEGEAPLSFEDTENSEPFRLVFVGRLAQEKGLSAFINSFPPGEWPRWELHLYGDGPAEASLHQRSINKNLGDKIVFHGKVPHPQILRDLPSYDALVLPSVIYENAPLTLVEAAFSGLRLLCSEWGGVGTLARFCGGEYLFNPESQASTAAALADLGRDLEARKPILRNRDKLERSFSYSRFIENHISIYQGLLSEGKKIKALFLDRDGILIEDRNYPHRPEDLKIREDILPLLQKAKARGYEFFIMTNQSGLARGIFTLDEYQRFAGLVEEEFSRRGFPIKKTYYCPYLADGTVAEFSKDSIDRKPKPGMFLRAAEEWNIELSQSLMIGDKDSDRIELSELRSIILRGQYEISDSSDVYDNVDDIIADLGWNDDKQD
jgi:D,D-heptose 1,7-bisphosphate phosphatase